MGGYNQILLYDKVSIGIIIQAKTIIAVLVLSVLVIATILVFSLENNTANAVLLKEKQVKIAVILPLSGSAAYYGEASMKGIELAKEELQNQFSNLELKVYYEDSLYTPKGGVDAYHKLIASEKIDAVITGASQVSLAVQPLAAKDGILQMAVFSSAEKYSTPNDISFRVSSRNEIEAEKIAEFVKGKDFESLGIVYLNNDFGVGFKEALKKKLTAVSPRTRVFEEGFSLDASDFRTILAKLRQSNAIFIVGTAKHYAIILNQAKELGINVQFLSMRSAEDPQLLEIAASAAEGLIYSYPFDKARTIKAQKFSNNFEA
ncbi:MAG TPA: amino acid ABC transporter substrate-binding protein, partial [Candidatus Diapherotrites archaeon]|nr:amino acid ABC transporter substrate-binding protein [Candidatus Diapherotrites archaeon]